MAITTSQIIQAARDILANQEEDSIGELLVPDEAILPILARAARRLNKILGSSTALKEIEFQTVANQQDYNVATVIGDASPDIQSVTRSGSLIRDQVLSDQSIDPRNGLAYPNSSGIIPQGYEEPALDVMIQQARFRLNDQYDWRTINVSNILTLRLFPCPIGIETVVVEYIATGYSVESLPDSATTALQFAACVAIIWGMINRFNSRMRQIAIADPTAGPSSIEKLKALQGQLQEYKDLYDAELVDLSQS